MYHLGTYVSKICGKIIGLARCRIWHQILLRQKFRFKFSYLNCSNYLEVTQKVIVKVEKILKGSLDSIPSPSPSMKIQITGGKVCLRCKGKTLLGVVNKVL